MPLPSVFQGVQDCRLPGLKPPKPFRRPPRQQLLQLHAPAICFSGGSRLPFARPQTLQTLPQASNGNNSYSYMPLPSVFQGVQDCRLPGLKPPKPFRRLFSGGSRLPFARPQTLQTLPQASKATTLTATCPCHLFLGGSRLPFARPQTLQTLPQASKATTLTATCPCHLFFRGFKAAVCPASNPPNPSAGLQGNNSYTCHLFFRGFKTAVCLASNSYMPLPSVFQGVQDCRLPGLKRSKPFRRPPRQQLLQLHAPAICFSGGSRLPFARPQTPQTLPQASKATTLTATCPCHLFFRGFKTAVCPASNPPNPSAGLQGNNSYSYMPLPSVFQGVQDCRLPGLKPSKHFRRPPRQQLLQLHAPAICFSGGSRLPFARPQTPQTLPQAFFRGFKTAVCPASNPPNPSAGLQGNNSYSYMPLPSVFQGVQDCRLPGLKPSKPFRRPPRQQLLQLHAPAICFSGGSRLPFARPQTPQTLPQAFFRGFKTAVCPASNAPNPSAGLQGNNSYSHMPLPSVFQGVQDCRLPGLKPPKPFRRPPRQQLLHLPSVFQGVQDCRLPGLKPPKPFRRPPRQQLLQLHAPAICFSGGSRLLFARPQTPQTLPQAFFRGFKTAVCPASNAPNPSAGLQGNNSYSYMPLPSVFQGVQDCRLPGLKPSKPFRRPPRQQLLQLHAPAICFSGGSRLPFARPQTPQTLPQASKATTLTPAICFSGGSRLPFARPQTPQTLPQASKATTLTATCPAICFSGGSRLPFARPQTLQTLPQASKATATCPCHLCLLFWFFCERKKGG